MSESPRPFLGFVPLHITNDIQQIQSGVVIEPHSPSPPSPRKYMKNPYYLQNEDIGPGPTKPSGWERDIPVQLRAYTISSALFENTRETKDAAMHEAVPAIAACGVSPIVRIADNQGHLVKRALDSGAHGIIVPLLYTPADAISLVRSAKFPPLGSRGFGSPFPMPCFSASLTSTAYLQQANSSLLTIVQIETSEALENVDEIAAVEGIDVLFVGPFDLGNNIARPVVDGVMHEELQVAIKKVLDTAVKRGKKAGIFCTDGLQGGKFRDMGFHMISVATDMFVLPAGVGGELNKARGNGQTVKMSGPYGR
ncbi:hypothetical protein B7494_g3128 [Chlorociboria aeruginascens]|nr:hypothetical protein B7494_g3128 [Chlorociboria aeruginascens]